MNKKCIYCEILAGNAPASIVYEDEEILSFMTLRPTRPGECLVIPKSHIDHFTDIPDELSAKIMVVAQKIGRKMLKAFNGDRIGMVIHGYGVPHAHLILFPQHTANDITSCQFAKISNGEIIFEHSLIPIVDRQILDEHALKLKP